MCTGCCQTEDEELGDLAFTKALAQGLGTTPLCAILRTRTSIKKERTWGFGSRALGCRPSNFGFVAIPIV
jgi:hypothetical protein